MTLRRTPLGYDALRVYARVLRDHTPHIRAVWFDLRCSLCDVAHPCPPWTRASEALDD